MLFQGRVDRAMKFQHDKNQPPEGDKNKELQDPKQEYDEGPIKDKLEKGDIFAMLLSAAGTLIPISLGVMLLIYFLARVILNV